MSAPPLRVMLVDDHEVVRDGIKLLLADTTDVVICAEASSAREAVAVAALLDPAVTKGVFDRLRRGKHLLGDEKLARLSPQEEGILSKLEVARRAEAAAYLARHHGRR
ncbi:MAG TPA: hypothetical protein VFJ69_04210 [Actinomycetota bacterium]|jgi:DNA-binding NarL/FixJ family response regulator|nr:hypothetical protein [Actinomycetota bacterium]